MLRHKMSAWGDESNWSDAHRSEVERCIRKYTATATSAGQDPMQPSEMWLAQYFHALRLKNGVGYARRFAAYVGHFLRRNKVEVLTRCPLVQAVLQGNDATDPLSLDVEKLQSAAKIGPAHRFADDAFAAETYRSYAGYNRKYIEWAEASQIDPLHPTIDKLATYFEILAVQLGPGGVNNRRSALGHYFRKNAVPDLSRDQKIKRVVEGLARVKLPEVLQPLTPDERRSLLASFEDRALDVRDRVAVLLVAFTTMTFDRITFLDVDQVTVETRGVTISSLNSDPPLFVGSHEEQDLNIVYWMSRLLELVPERGPLFRASIPRRFAFGDSRLSPMAITAMFRRAAKASGLPSKKLCVRLRSLFDAELEGNVSPIVRARYENNRNLPRRIEQDQADVYRAINRKRKAHGPPINQMSLPRELSDQQDARELSQ